MQNDDIGITPAALSALARGDIANAIIASVPGGIEAQEAQGQKDLVESDMLPKQCPQEQLEQLGFEFGKDVDDIFISCKFPKGWKKVATDHAMGTDLVDDKGRIRGNIFYKAAFYDRRADMQLSKRFRATFEPEDRYKSKISHEERNKSPWFARVYDQDKVVFESEPYNGKVESSRDKGIKQATNWLQEHYPEWEDVLAYWD